jgi:hypothetical protein
MTVTESPVLENCLYSCVIWVLNFLNDFISSSQALTVLAPFVNDAIMYLHISRFAQSFKIFITFIYDAFLSGDNLV